MPEPSNTRFQPVTDGTSCGLWTMRWTEEACRKGRGEARTPIQGLALLRQECQVPRLSVLLLQRTELAGAHLEGAVVDGVDAADEDGADGVARRTRRPW